MSDEAGPQTTSPGVTTGAQRREHVRIAVWAGVVLASIGVVLGVLMAAQRHEVTCPDGATVSFGGDFRCYAHPEALEGSAVVVISVMLAILILLVGSVAASGADVRSQQES